MAHQTRPEVTTGGRQTMPVKVGWSKLIISQRTQANRPTRKSLCRFQGSFQRENEQFATSQIMQKWSLKDCERDRKAPKDHRKQYKSKVQLRLTRIKTLSRLSPGYRHRKSTAYCAYHSHVVNERGLLDVRWFQPSKADRAIKAKGHFVRPNCSSRVPLPN